MFTVHIVGHGGVEAEFVVPSPILAFDLVLRAVRAGICWRALSGKGELRALSLARLYELAERHASTGPACARHLQEVIGADRAAAAAGLN